MKKDTNSHAYGRSAVADNLLNTNVLVLNKLYMALRIVTVRRAFIFLAKDYAEVIYKNNGRFESHRFGSWVQVSSENNGNTLPARPACPPSARTSRSDGSAFGRGDRSGGDEYIHTPNQRILIPRVIRLLEYDKMPKREWKLNRKNILIRDNYQCQYCGKKYPLSSLTIDHIIPRFRGGTATWTNVVTCCNKCNTKKGGRLPQEAGMKLITKPQKPNFNSGLSQLLNDKKYSIWKEFIKD